MFVLTVSLSSSRQIQDDKDLSSGVQGFAAGANRIWKLDWTFFARNHGRFQGFHRNEKLRSEAKSANHGL